MVETLWDAITRRATDFIEGGQERRQWLDDLGRKAEYYVPPELRNILGFVAEATPTAAIDRAAQAGGEMLAPGRTPMQRLGSAGEMLSETAGVVAPAMVANRAAIPAAQAIQESLLGASVAADDVGRRFVERLNQPGPVPTMYSNPVDFEAFKKARAQEDFARKIKSVVEDVSSGAYQTRLDEAAFDLHKSGNLPLPVGTRVSPPSHYEMGNDLRVSGYWIDPQDANVFGYKLANDAGEEFSEFVSNPKLGLRPRSADRFGAGFKAFAGPNADDRLGFSAPSTSSIQTDTPEPVPSSVQREYDDLFGISLPAPRNEAEAMAKQVLEMRAAGRAGDVTDEMMAAADPQYMFANTPLPMDEASRMVRAREAGFQGGLLHGTGSDISAIDPTRLGEKQNVLGKGFYQTTSPERSERYVPKAKDEAGNTIFAEGGNVMPLMSKSADEFDLTAPTGKKNISRIAKAFEGTDFNIDLRDGGDSVFIQSKTDPKMSVFLDSYQEGQSTLMRLKDAFGNNNLTPILEEAGFTGLKGAEGRGSNVRVNYNPEDVRSRFARFDPEFSHLRNLSAGIGGLGILSLLAQQDQEVQ